MTLMVKVLVDATLPYANGRFAPHQAGEVIPFHLLSPKLQEKLDKLDPSVLKSLIAE